MVTLVYPLKNRYLRFFILLKCFTLSLSKFLLQTKLNNIYVSLVFPTFWNIHWHFAEISNQPNRFYIRKGILNVLGLKIFVKLDVFMKSLHAQALDGLY